MRMRVCRLAVSLDQMKTGILTAICNAAMFRWSTTVICEDGRGGRPRRGRERVWTRCR